VTMKNCAMMKMKSSIILRKGCYAYYANLMENAKSLEGLFHSISTNLCTLTAPFGQKKSKKRQMVSF
jgi:hypothetical protein